MRNNLRLDTLSKDLLRLIFKLLSKIQMARLFVVNKKLNQLVLDYLRQANLLLEFQPGELCFVVAGATALRMQDQTLRAFTQADIRAEQFKILNDKDFERCPIFKEKKHAEAFADASQHWYEAGTALPRFAHTGTLVRIVFECKIALNFPLRLYLGWLPAHVKSLPTELAAQLESLNFEQRKEILSTHGIIVESGHTLFTKNPHPFALAKKSSITFFGRGYPYTNATGALEVRNDENGWFNSLKNLFA